jgi:protease I
MADLSDLKVQLVAAEKNFRDEELFIPENIFSGAELFVSIASNEKKNIKGMLGGSVDADIAIRDINTDDIDALVIAGGSGSPDYLWYNDDLLEKIRESYRKGKIIGAICLSGAVLAQAGILKGKRATVYPSEEAIMELKENGATFVNEGVVTGDGIVTAQGPSNATDFARAILSLIEQKVTEGIRH